ncbi:MAG: hypothetical protein Q7K40_03420 [bacterium]|nr:hypothetical protein [bacterium]
MLRNKKTIISILIIVSIVTLIFWLYSLRGISKGDTGKNIFGEQILPPGTPADIATYRGVITEGSKGYNTYTSKKYGIQFSYPEKWRVGDNHLGYGTFQLFNFFNQEEGAMRAGKNKIEIYLNPIYAYNKPDTADIDTKILTKKIIISGQLALRSEIEFSYGDGTSMISYEILIPTIPDKYLGMSMYGDPANFHILDEMVKTIKWLPTEKDCKSFIVKKIMEGGFPGRYQLDDNCSDPETK